MYKWIFEGEWALRVVIVGAGKVGFEIAKRLSFESHDVTIIDERPDALEQVSAHLDVMTVVGNGAGPSLLEQVGIDRTHLMVAVTDIDEVNMIACTMAKQYGVKTCVARIRNPDYTSSKSNGLSIKRLGIDHVIDPERLAAHEVERLLQMPFATEVDTFADGQITIAGFEVTSEAPIVGVPLSNLQFPDTLIVALIRDNEVIIPQGDTMIHPNDELFVIGRTPDLTQLRSLIDPRQIKIERVAIIGGGRIGYNLAKALQPRRNSHMHVMLFEKDHRRAQFIAESLPHVLVIEGDGTKIDVLRDEALEECDAFIAVSGEDHTNLLSTMLAHEFGIKVLITEVTREDYVPLARRAGADAVIVPRLLMIGSVIRLVRTSSIVTTAFLHEGKAEALELIAPMGAPFVNKPLRKVRFPHGAIVGAVVNEGNAEVARGDTVIRPKDRVIVFALPDVVQKVERLFGPAEGLQ